MATLSAFARLAGRRILFICGSLNQTTMLHKIANELAEHEAYFTPFYADGFLRRAAEIGLLDFTTLGGRPRRQTEAYLAEHGLRTDVRGEARDYALVVTGTDLVVPRNVRGRPLVLVQEGMMDPEDWRYSAVRSLGLPRYLANTSMTGLSHAYETFCVASPGYRDLFAGKGVPAEKMVVTGIPNFDDAESFRQNSFPHRGFVLAATSCLRETLKAENRRAFLLWSLRIADGRPLIVKLHPNERVERATREVHRLTKDALVLAEGNTNHMIANCEVLVTRYSSVVYVALALGKEVHADMDIHTLRRLMPVQNGGRSAHNIAQICRRFLS
jgi:hypothetical protein